MRRPIGYNLAAATAAAAVANVGVPQQSKPRSRSSGWKGDMFKGRCALTSDRDATGASFNSAAHEGGSVTHLLRNVADISGPFVVSTGQGDLPPLGPELTPCQPVRFAPLASVRFPERSLGTGDEQAYLGLNACLRCRDPTRDFVISMDPQLLRQSSPRNTAAKQTSPVRNYGENTRLQLHSRSAGQSRYEEWIMRSDVPEPARAYKEQLLETFDKLPSFRELAEERQPLASPKAVEKKPAQEPGGTTTKVVVGSGATTFRTGLGIRLPETADEVGRLMEEMDALQTIMDVTGPEGSSANNCPVGWISGYRKVPMSEDEIRRVRNLERATKSKPRGLGRPPVTSMS